MDKTIKREETIRIRTCDVCGNEAIAYHRSVKPCYFCGKHVCPDCAIETDVEYLEPGVFMGDYPDHFCNTCWNRGQVIRGDIRQRRREEEELFEVWRRSCLMK